MTTKVMWKVQTPLNSQFNYIHYERDILCIFEETKINCVSLTKSQEQFIRFNIEKYSCTKKRFDKFNTIFENLKYVVCFSMYVYLYKKEFANVFCSKIHSNSNIYE